MTIESAEEFAERLSLECEYLEDGFRPEEAAELIEADRNAARLTLLDELAYKTQANEELGFRLDIAYQQAAHDLRAKYGAK